MASEYDIRAIYAHDGTEAWTADNVFAEDVVSAVEDMLKRFMPNRPVSLLIWVTDCALMTTTRLEMSLN